MLLMIIKDPLGDSVNHELCRLRIDAEVSGFHDLRNSPGLIVTELRSL
jgi:hypothetical protein